MGGSVRQDKEPSRLAVHQNLTIERVRRRGANLRVRVRHPGGSTDWVSYGPAVAASHECFVRLSLWKRRRTLLTYVRGNGMGVLIDDRAFFEAAFVGD